MRKIIFFVLIFSISSCYGYAQTTFLNGNAPVGIGTNSPGSSSGAILDVQNHPSVAVQAQFGQTRAVYLMANSGNLGFNTYYNGAWKWGAGSTNSYGGAIGFDHETGALRYWVSTNAGNSNEVIYSHNYGFSVLQNGNFGIGTTNPEFNLDVNGTSRVKQLNIRNDGAGGGGKLVIHSENGGDYNQIYAEPNDGRFLNFMGWKYFNLKAASGEELVFNPYQDIAWRLYQSNSTGAMTLWGHQGKGAFITKDITSEKIGFRTYFSDGNFKHEFYNGNVYVGNNAAPVDLLVNGNTITKKVKVTQENWADYVFEPSYRLPSLQEVEAFIKQHKHLPDVPSAKEVEQNGLDLGENQGVLLKKIEELTLYIIEMKKEIEKLKKKSN